MMQHNMRSFVLNIGKTGLRKLVGSEKQNHKNQQVVKVKAQEVPTWIDG